MERIKEGKRLLAISRIALKRIYYLSYAYRMTGDKKYAHRAEQEMLAVSRFTDWNPTHFLDVGEMVMALVMVMTGCTILCSPHPPGSARSNHRERLRRGKEHPSCLVLYS